MVNPILFLKAKTTQDKGRAAETAALHYLERQGLRLIKKNFYTKLGEIDLIMSEKDSIVFVEVRYREQHSHGSGLETVTHQKQMKLIRTATQYLQKHYQHEHVNCRFDVISMTRIKEQYAIEWVKDACQSNY